MRSTSGRAGDAPRGGYRGGGAERRGTSLLVKLSVLLSAAALAVLGGIIFLDLPQIEWTRSILYFFLFAVLGWTLFYIGFRWLIIPLVLVVVLYLVFVSGVVRQWGCCQPDDQLLRIKVIAQQPANTDTETETVAAAAAGVVTKIELHGPAGGDIADFLEVEGESLKVLLSTVRLKPWVFYPRCAFLFRVHSVTGLTSELRSEPEQAAETVGIKNAGLPLKVLLKAGVAEIEQVEVVQSELQVLSSYVLFVDKNTPKFRTQR